MTSDPWSSPGWNPSSNPLPVTVDHLPRPTCTGHTKTRFKNRLLPVDGALERVSESSWQSIVMSSIMFQCATRVECLMSWDLIQSVQPDELRHIASNQSKDVEWRHLAPLAGNCSWKYSLSRHWWIGVIVIQFAQIERNQTAEIGTCVWRKPFNSICLSVHGVERNRLNLSTRSTHCMIWK